MLSYMPAAFLAVLMLVSPVPQATSGDTAVSPVFRGPFTLKLRIDKDRSYEEHFERVPYVADNNIYLFAGEHFGINLTMAGDEISSVSYQPDIAKADVELKVSQDAGPGGRTMMMLMIKNKVKRQLFLDALITVPGKKEEYKTSILPVQPGLSGFEAWPHPIVQLVLRNLRFKAK